MKLAKLINRTSSAIWSFLSSNSAMKTLKLLGVGFATLVGGLCDLDRDLGVVGGGTELLFCASMEGCFSSSRRSHATRKRRDLSPGSTALECSGKSDLVLERASNSCVKSITWTGAEPNPFLRERLHDALDSAHLTQGRIVNTTIQELLDTAQPNTFDAILSSLTLCTVPNVPELLKNVR